MLGSEKIVRRWVDEVMEGLAENRRQNPSE
jgi:hypothetical protein